MLSYLTMGADDLERSGAFYDSVLLPLGYRKHAGEGYLQYAPEGVADRDNGPGTVYVMKPFDGRAASAGNGVMPAFRAADDEAVRSLHAAGISAGGSDEGAPGTRSIYSAGFYVAYLRDPVGNKLALFALIAAT
jgi:catechol 2,3-dioxygenase-like lactoylglutathione lyase family enzyme